MKLAVFDTHAFDEEFLKPAAALRGHELVFFETRLTAQTASLAGGFPAVCSFVNDRVDAACLKVLAAGGTRFVVLRSAGYNHVDVAAAQALGVRVARVPEYSPHAVAEHTFALLLALVRHVPRAVARVRDANFALEGLVGFDLAGKQMGVVGTGRIGRLVAQIAAGFGMAVVAADPSPDATTGLRYVSLPELLAASDIVTLHCPLTPQTHHIIDGAALASMKRRTVLLNTGRGALIDAAALVAALKAGRIFGAALDVYEEEAGVFFEDRSSLVLQDDVLARLLSFPNVIMTSHQAFLTVEALEAIARATMANVSDLEEGTRPLVNEVLPEPARRESR